MIPPATSDQLETTELRPALPPNLPPRLQSLMYVHLRVTSHRHQARVASRDGTVHRLADGPVMRVRTGDLLHVPPLERTPCWGTHGTPDCPHHLERTTT